LSTFRLGDANVLNGRPLRNPWARSAALALNLPKLTEKPSKQAAISPLVRASSVT
jgi:hypothetical protein